MRKILIVVVVIAGIIGVGVGIGFLAGHGMVSPAPVAPVAPVASDNASKPAQDAPADTASSAQYPPLQPLQPFVPQAAQTNLAATTSSNALAGTNWENAIDDIVGSDDADTNKVKQLFALFPTLPPDGQEEAVQHLSNLVEDDNYAQLGNMLKDSSLSQGVLDELLADALNRPNSLKLPVLLSVAQEPDNVESSEAKDLLELYLGQDYGSNWSDWQSGMTNWLGQNPD